jgi:hypothetical protein
VFYVLSKGKYRIMVGDCGHFKPAKNFIVYHQMSLAAYKPQDFLPIIV